MKNIFGTFCLGVALYVGVTMFFAEEPVYYNQTITVHSGDTVWSIACNWCDDSESVSDVVDRIYEANNLTTHRIHPGQTLVIPVLENK